MKSLILNILLLTLFISCGPDYKQARLVKVGMSTDDLVTIMGEPFSIEINSNNEEWYFTYRGPSSNNEGMVVRIVDKKIVNFYSY